METAADPMSLELEAQSLACFAVGAQRLGIDVRDVREVVRNQMSTPLPQAPPMIEGVADLRGGLIPVVDLGKMLGSEAVGDNPAARLAVIEFGGMMLALRVDEAVDVMSLRSDELSAPPELASSSGYRMLSGMIRRADGPPVLLLSLGHLIERIQLSGTFGATAQEERR